VKIEVDFVANRTYTEDRKKEDGMAETLYVKLPKCACCGQERFVEKIVPAPAPELKKVWPTREDREAKIARFKKRVDEAMQEELKGVSARAAMTLFYDGGEQG